MERILLKLYNSYLPGLTQKEWSNALSISQRHLSRLLQKYQQQGVLSFFSGRGRGNKTIIDWYINIDEQYCTLILQRIDRDNIEESLPLLNWEWTNESRQKLLLKVYSFLGTVQNGKDKLTIKRRYAKNTIHPLELFDIETRRVLVNIYETLITMDDAGQIHYKLAHHIDFEETQCIIHLRKNIYFHDGTLMKSHHVVSCLEAAKASAQLGDLMTPLASIEIINDSTLIIHHQSIPYLPYLLGSLHLAIYLKDKQAIYGTGPFFIADDNDLKTTLKNFTSYWGIHALLDEVELLYLPDLRLNQHASKVSTQ